MHYRRSRHNPARRLPRLLLSCLGILLVGYFLYHTILGERGWLAMLRMQHEVNVAQSNLTQLKEEREEVEHKVKLLRSNNLDPDLLEEKSRELLNYSKPNEIIILTPETKKK